MSKKFRKVLAAILAGTMVLGSGVVANAAEGSGEGTGSVDVVEAEDIFSVVLPTSAGKQFNYILDPTGVIAKTNFEKYGGTASASFVEGETMYFRNQPASGSNVATYSNVSDPIKAYNKSTMAVEIQVKAHLATPSGIIIATSSVANPGTTEKATPSIYLALTPDGGTTKKPITTTEKVVATSSLADAKANYKVVYATDSKTYKTSLATGSTAKTDAEYAAANFDCYSFSLTGDCNPNGKWIGLTEEPPKVTLVWTIQKPEGAFNADGPTISVANNGLITMSGLTAEKNYASAAITDHLGASYTVKGSDGTWIGDGTTWSSENGGTLQLQLGTAWMNALRGRTGKITLTLTDGTSIEAPISIS